MENIFTEENMYESVERLLLKNDSCGVDGIMISEYKAYYDLNGEQIRQQLLSGKYKPDAVQIVEILMKNGKRRPISKYTCTDRVILDVLKMMLTPLWSTEFSKYSYAYQENKGVQEAVNMYMEKYHFCRFSDDINIYCDSMEQAEQYMNAVENFLGKELGLQCNRAKCGIYPALSRRFLGYEFYKKKDDTKVYIKKYKSENQAYYKKWNTSAIQKIDQNYHLINDGILTKKDFTILFENQEGKHYLPVETCRNCKKDRTCIFA